MRAALLLALITTLALSTAVRAQTEPETSTEDPSAAVPSAGFRDLASSTGRLVSSIVTIDRDALFFGSRFGQRVQRELEQDTEALAAENRRIEGELIAEEKELTSKRNAISAEEFAPLAEAFDVKVQNIRNEQDQKSLSLQRRLDLERQAFLNVVTPILGEIAQSRGAVAVLDRNLVLLAFEGIDITDEAIARIDARIGDNAPGQLTPPSPAPRPVDDSPNADNASE